MSEMIILRGVPGSGKTTAAMKWLAEGENRGRVSRDDIRFSLFGKYWGVDENLVTKVQDAQIEALLSAGKDVIVDATNLRARNVKALMQLAAKNDARIKFVDFPISYEDAIFRDAQRESRGERSVGEDVIKSFFDKFIRKGELPPIPVLDEVGLKFKPYVLTLGLPHCIIVDIDGTLAHMTDRGPYDTSRYYTDELDETVALLVDTWRLAGERVILMSGRSEEFRMVTEAWLMGHGVLYDELHMRPSGDVRNDAIVKDELFEKHIAGKYNVDFILDDRDRVVEMWRAKGLKCLQVAPGNF